MTAPSIISDQEAREIARRYGLGLFDAYRVDADTFRHSGAITAGLVEWAQAVLDRDPNHRLAAYVSHHGERGPQTGGYVVTVEPKCCDTYAECGDRHADDCERFLFDWTPRERAELQPERHPVDTLEDAKQAARHVVFALPREDRVTHSLGYERQSEWVSIVLGEISDLDEDGGDTELPNGDKISVERVPDWSER